MIKTVKNIILGAALLSGTTQLSASDVDLGIHLPDGFKATILADGIGKVRHLAVTDSGWVYGALARKKDGKGIVGLKDDNGDGVADQTVYFGDDMSGTGMAIHKGHLYFGANQYVVRFKLDASGKPTGAKETIVKGMLKQGNHAAKSLTFDDKGHMYVNVGAPSNACMEKSRTKGSPGMMPCPQLKYQASVWQFKDDVIDQTQDNGGVQYSTGHRNAVALEWSAYADDLYLVQHGRDQLFSLFPDLFPDEQASGELPAEEFHRIKQGADLGWPYSYYDPSKGSRMMMPEYGGDGVKTSDIGQKPIADFPGHWAPNDLIFVSEKTGLAKGTALIAFHGSWNRKPAQAGYNVVAVPMAADGSVGGDWSVFADGFATGVRGGTVTSPADAKHRPMGLAEGPDGALYIGSLMQDGRIWRITHE